jgi:hypothetical protein
MRLPKRIELLYVPAQIAAEAHVVPLTRTLIRRRMGSSWWDDATIDPEAAGPEIDRQWDWSAEDMERDGRVLKSRKLAAMTGDGAVQGAMLVSTEPVACEREPGEFALFVGLLLSRRATDTGFAKIVRNSTAASASRYCAAPRN